MAVFEENAPKRVISLFSLIMINIIAVDSIRTLPFSAELGASLIFYYLICGIFFLVPVALIASELATAWPERGGIYVWVKHAFGKKWGFLVCWLQWVYNVVWYPTILNFVAATVAYFFEPGLIHNKYYIITFSLIIFWFVTFINCLGMKSSSLMSSIGSILGVIFPMTLIISLASFWLYGGNEVSINLNDVIPKVTSIKDLSLITVILFGLMGLEMSAVHAKEVKNPEKNYPKAMLISSIIILLSLMLSSLAIALVVPREKLNLTVGVLQGFEMFLEKFDILYLLPVLAVLMLVGVVSTIGAWVIGPAKGLLAAAEDDVLPAFMRGTNKKGVPVRILLIQAVIVSILSFSYALLDVEVAYLVLTELTSILALLMYVLMFLAAIKLRYSHKSQERHFEIPTNLGMWIAALSGLAITFIGIFVSFFPPSQIEVKNEATYHLLLILGTVLFCLPALCLNRK